MKTKILVGSVFVLALLLLIPSTPAIQKKTIEEKANDTIQEKVSVLIPNLLQKIKVSDVIKYPILNILYHLMVIFRIIHAAVLLEISFIICSWLENEIENKDIVDQVFNILFLRVIWLVITTGISLDLVEKITEELGWNWFFPALKKTI